MASADWSGGLVHNGDVTWHALRGVDLAGLSSILRDGVQPSRNSSSQGLAFEICASGSPEMYLANGREANSFLAYTMNNSSISLALNAPGRHEPNGGFVDERRIPNAVPADSVLGVTLNDALLDTRLTAVEASFETMRPEQSAAYIDRNLALPAHLAARSGRAFTPQPELLDFANRSMASPSGHQLSAAETTQMHKAVMGAYAAALASPTNPEPTVRDALQAVLAESPYRPPVLTWNKTHKTELMARSQQLTAFRAASYPTMGRSRGPTGTAQAGPTYHRKPTRQHKLGD